MRIPIIAATLAAVAIPAMPAAAQHYGANDVQNQREYRAAQQRWRADMRDWRHYRNYDYNRTPPGQSAYYANQYYRDGRYYQPRRLSASDRVYRGNDNRYYCRRSDGTTGLIVGGIAGGLFGNLIASGGSKTLGTLLGAAGGAAIGSSVDRNNSRNVTCR